MSDHNITVESGTSVRLPTAGKYCDRDIVITATGGDYGYEDGIVTRNGTEYINDRVTSIGQYAFYRNSTLRYVSFPNVTTISQYALGNCSNLTDINFPSLKTLGAYVFQNCTKLAKVEFPSLTKMNTAPFTGSTALTTIILPGTTVCELGASNSLSGTPIASGEGFIFVNDDLVDEYKVASRWSEFADQIKPISELEEIAES